MSLLTNQGGYPDGVTLAGHPDGKSDPIARSTVGGMQAFQSDLDVAQQTIAEALAPLFATVAVRDASDKQVKFVVTLRGSAERCKPDGVLTGKWFLEQLSVAIGAAARSL